MSFRHTRLARAVALAALSVTGSQAFAQGALEEIVVTAQKREQSLQEAPIAISAFNADALEQQGISDVQELSGLVPNVMFNAAPSSTTGATVAIRGAVTTNPAITWEPTVGMYVDGVFIGKVLGGIFDVADLERIEVLRGPQGSLYGKNTVGGAVNLVTRKPTGEFGGKLEASAGNYGYFRVLGSVDTGAVGTVGEGLGRLSANITLQHEERDGFTRAIDDPVGSPFAVPNTPARDWDGTDGDAGRIALALDVTDALDVRYAYDFSKKDNTPQAPALTNSETFSPAHFFLAPYVQDEDKRPDKLSSDTDVFEESDIEGHSLHINYAINDGLSLKSVTSYREMSWSDLLDIDGSAVDGFHSGRDIDYEARSQELQLVGSTDHLNYVAGVYYFKEEADVFNPITFFGVFYPPGFALPNAYGLESESKAVFGQIDWNPAAMEQLTVTVGARYTDEKKDQYISHPLVLGADGAPDPALAFAGEADDDWQNFAPSLTLAWAFTDSINGYARFAKGWKSGGFNGESGTLASFQRSYDPEEVDSYELGIKTRWLDDTVQLNAAVFQNKVDEMQLSIFLADGSAASVVDNAGKATVEGFELEFLAEPVENLQINVNYGYLDAAYDEYIDGGVNVADDRAVPYAPDNTASAGIQYTIPGVMGGNLIGRLDWTYTDDRVLYTEPAQNLHSQLDSYSLLNGRITLADIEMGDGTLKVAAWGKNLLDEDYRMSTIPFIIWTVSYYGAPRTYGMEVQYQF